MRLIQTRSQDYAELHSELASGTNGVLTTLSAVANTLAPLHIVTTSDYSENFTITNGNGTDTFPRIAYNGGSGLFRIDYSISLTSSTTDNLQFDIVKNGDTRLNIRSDSRATANQRNVSASGLAELIEDDYIELNATSDATNQPQVRTNQIVIVLTEII